MKKLNLIYFLGVLLIASAVTTSTTSCSQKKGFNYSSHNKRNKKNQRFVNSRVKKTKGDHTKVKCR
jgi:cell division protein FtsL